MGLHWIFHCKKIKAEFLKYLLALEHTQNLPGSSYIERCFQVLRCFARDTDKTRFWLLCLTATLAKWQWPLDGPLQREVHKMWMLCWCVHLNCFLRSTFCSVCPIYRCFYMKKQKRRDFTHRDVYLLSQFEMSSAKTYRAWRQFQKVSRYALISSSARYSECARSLSGSGASWKLQ